MPTVMKRKTSHVEARRNFAPYEGPTPTKGTYRGKINKLVMEKASSGNLMYFAVVELEARAGNTRMAEYDGYPAMGRIVLTDKEANLSREQALYLAVSGKADADVRTETDVAKFKNGDKQQSKVLKINGKDPIGVYVLVELVENEYEGETRMQLDTIYPTRDQNAGPTKPDPEPDEDDEDDVDDEEVEEYEEDELKALGLPALRKNLVEEFEYSPEDAAKLKTKSKLVGEILDAQTDARGEDEDDEDDVDDETDDEADGDEDDEDREAEIREEVQALSRNQVKAALKKYKVHADRVFKKTEDDEALQEELIQMRLQDPPF